MRGGSGRGRGFHRLLVSLRIIISVRPNWNDWKRGEGTLSPMREREGVTRTRVTFRTGNGRKRRWGGTRSARVREGRRTDDAERSEWGAHEAQDTDEEWGKTQMRDERMRDGGYARDIVARSWI